MSFLRYWYMLSNERYLSLLLLFFFIVMLSFVIVSNFLYKDYIKRQEIMEIMIKK